MQLDANICVGLLHFEQKVFASSLRLISLTELKIFGPCALQLQTILRLNFIMRVWNLHIVGWQFSNEFESVLFVSLYFADDILRISSEEPVAREGDFSGEGL